MMDDQGEKIVFLAREILNSGMAAEKPKEKLNVTLTFKTLCLTTLLAAASGGLAATALHANEMPLNRYEKIEINALVFYAAQLKGLSEDALKSEVAQKVGLSRLEDLTRSDFSAARRYLQERAQ